MYQTHKTYIKPDMKMSDLINENYSLLLLLEHLEIDFAVGDQTVRQVCKENNINQSVFLVVSNLYNGFYPNKDEIFLIDGISDIIKLLKNSHRFYKEDKYPEIKEYIHKLHEKHKTNDIVMIESFFKEYFEEVLEHLNYEEKIAFPYFCQLIETEAIQTKSKFSAGEYKEHHSDIETKLSDLKNLMLKHIAVKTDLTLRRKFLYCLFELEFDLKIHSIIEEMILLPLIAQIEKQRLNG
jgi:regulator of cell morphogenesis and NO signaling